jgi:hypothetical protein
MTDDPRPEWKHKTPEDLARWLAGNHVTKITHHWEMTGPDTSRDWLMLHSKTSERQVATRFFTNNSEFAFAPDHAQLVSEQPYAKVRETIKQIDDWEKKNARDRLEYERLKTKFGG